MALNDFAYWQIQSNVFQETMVQRSTGTTATGIQRAQLVKLPFVVPPVSEQERIDESLRAIDDRLTQEQSQQHKLIGEKYGLMDDLLTGRVRVMPLLDTAEQAAG